MHWGHESPIRRQGYQGRDVASPSTVNQPTAGQYRHPSSKSLSRRRTGPGTTPVSGYRGIPKRLYSVKFRRFEGACVIATEWRRASRRLVMTCDGQRDGGLGRLALRMQSDLRKVEAGGAGGPHTCTGMRYHDKSCSLVRFRRWQAVGAGVGSASPTTHSSSPIPSSTRHPGVYGGGGEALPLTPHVSGSIHRESEEPILLPCRMQELEHSRVPHLRSLARNSSLV